MDRQPNDPIYQVRESNVKYFFISFKEFIGRSLAFLGRRTSGESIRVEEVGTSKSFFHAIWQILTFSAENLHRRWNWQHISARKRTLGTDTVHTDSNRRPGDVKGQSLRNIFRWPREKLNP